MPGTVTTGWAGGPAIKQKQASLFYTKYKFSFQTITSYLTAICLIDPQVIGTFGVFIHELFNTIKGEGAGVGNFVTTRYLEKWLILSYGGEGGGLI